LEICDVVLDASTALAPARVGVFVVEAIFYVTYMTEKLHMHETKCKTGCK
jgi:hypothetical protein